MLSPVLLEAPTTKRSLKSGVPLLPSHNTQPAPVPPVAVDPIKFAAPDHMIIPPEGIVPPTFAVSYTHLRAHET